VSNGTLLSACLAQRCSSSRDLVAPCHHWSLAPREQMGIGHKKGAERSGEGLGWAAHTDALTVAGAGRFRAVCCVVVSTGALVCIGVVDGAPVATRGWVWGGGVDQGPSLVRDG
jgi:hypothetical protein